jgi:hypothetical protein
MLLLWFGVQLNSYGELMFEEIIRVKV